MLLEKNSINGFILVFFEHAYNDFLNTYRQKNAKTLKNLFIDATIIKNKSIPIKLTGFCKKIPNKHSIKLSAICDSVNKINHSYLFTESNAHDSKHIEEAVKLLPSTITNSATYQKPIIITGDLGYITNRTQKLYLRKKYHVTINTDVRRNMKKKNKTVKNKQLLTKRVKVEHFNSRLFNTFKTFSTMKYFLFERLEALYKLVSIIQMFEFLYEHNL